MNKIKKVEITTKTYDDKLIRKAMEELAFQRYWKARPFSCDYNDKNDNHFEIRRAFNNAFYLSKNIIYPTYQEIADMVNGANPDIEIQKILMAGMLLMKIRIEELNELHTEKSVTI